MSIKMLEKSTPASWLTELPPLGMDAKSISADFRHYFSPVSYTHLDVYKRQKETPHSIRVRSAAIGQPHPLESCPLGVR